MDKQFIIGVSLATIVIFVGGVWFLSAQNANESKKLDTPLLGQKIDDMGGIHVRRGESHIAYNSNPPTSGPHWADGTAGPGVHDKEVPDELLVHSLEHGAAILSYRADLSRDQIKFLTDAFYQSSGKTIMVPRKSLTSDVALTSWNRLQTINNIDTASSSAQMTQKQIKDFLETNNDRGPESAPI